MLISTTLIIDYFDHQQLYFHQALSEELHHRRRTPTRAKSTPATFTNAPLDQRMYPLGVDKYSYEQNVAQLKTVAGSQNPNLFMIESLVKRTFMTRRHDIVFNKEDAATLVENFPFLRSSFGVCFK